MRRVCVSVARRGYATTEFSKHSFLKELGLSEVNAGVYDGQWFGSGAKFASVNPTTGNVIAHVTGGTPADYARVVKSIRAAQPVWAAMPAPRRGEIVRQVGNALREVLEPLGKLVSLEVGKSKVEGVGEVQEYVDVCDFAVGLSRTLQGQLLPSERPNHVLLERYHPLGCIGVITAFSYVCPHFFFFCLFVCPLSLTRPPARLSQRRVWLEQRLGHDHRQRHVVEGRTVHAVDHGGHDTRGGVCARAQQAAGRAGIVHRG